MWKFIREVKKDFNPAYKYLIKNMKRWVAGNNPWTAPFDGYRKYPGRNTHLKLFNLIMGTMVAMGIITGLLLAVPTIVITVYFFGSFYYLVFLLLLLLLLVLCPVILYQMNNYLLGYMGERVVAEALEECSREPTWRLFHALNIRQLAGGDIDHVVVCPKGVFCVETKASRWTKDKKITVEIYEKIDKKTDQILLDGSEFRKEKPPIPQARKAAIALHNFLNKQCSFDVPFVIPIVLLADDSKSKHYFFNEFSNKLIVGKSSSIKDIFKEIDDMPDKLSMQEIDQIGKILEEENRVKIEE